MAQPTFATSAKAPRYGLQAIPTPNHSHRQRVVAIRKKTRGYVMLLSTGKPYIWFLWAYVETQQGYTGDMFRDIQNGKLWNKTMRCRFAQKRGITPKITILGSGKQFWHIHKAGNIQPPQTESCQFQGCFIARPAQSPTISIGWFSGALTSQLCFSRVLHVTWQALNPRMGWPKPLRNKQ